MADIEVLSPVAPSRIEERALAPRLKQLAGARIAWFDNMKANAADLLNAVAKSMDCKNAQLEHELAAKDPTAAAPANQLEFLKRCDAVVLAIAD